MSNLLDIT